MNAIRHYTDAYCSIMQFGRNFKPGGASTGPRINISRDDIKTLRKTIL